MFRILLALMLVVLALMLPACAQSPFEGKSQMNQYERWMVLRGKDPKVDTDRDDPDLKQRLRPLDEQQ
jgi:hypothetical protein